MGNFGRFVNTGILALLLATGAQAERAPSHVTSEIAKTQHFRKYVYSNSSAVPVTVRVQVSGDNVKVNKSLPFSFVVPARNKIEAFQTSAKDPRTYYGDPTVEEDYAFGDYRVTRSNVPLALPWARGKAVKVVDVAQTGSVHLEMEKDTPVLCARQGLVVMVEGDAVWVAHNDGCLSRYTGLGSASANLDSEVNVGQVLGKVGNKGLSFELAVPTTDLGYRGIPAYFSVGASKRELSAGETVTP